MSKPKNPLTETTDNEMPNAAPMRTNITQSFAERLDALNALDFDAKLNTANRADNARVIIHEIKVAELAKKHPVEKDDPAAIAERSGWYFAECAANNVKPSIAGYASALGCGRKTLQNWLNGETKVPEASLKELQRAYGIIDALMNDYLLNGYIDKVAAFFIMKNGLNYKDDPKDGDIKPIDEEKTPEEIAAAYKDLPS